MSAVLKDTKDLADKQTPIYVTLAVVLATIILMLTLKSTIMPYYFNKYRLCHNVQFWN